MMDLVADFFDNMSRTLLFVIGMLSGAVFLSDNPGTIGACQMLLAPMLYINFMWSIICIQTDRDEEAQVRGDDLQL